MTKFVLDASVAAAWTLPDEASPEAAALLDKAADGVLAPFHYPSEIANVVLMAQRRGRVLESELPGIRRTLERVPVEIDSDSVRSLWSEVYPLAQTHNLSLYDALYLELALRRGAPLASFDKRLRDAAIRAGVELII